MFLSEVKLTDCWHHETCIWLPARVKEIERQSSLIVLNRSHRLLKMQLIKAQRHPADSQWPAAISRKLIY
jgi:hypothetical protein